MLLQERYSKILSFLSANGSVTIDQLQELLDASESTVRRTLNVMDEQGLLKKVYGGAVAIDSRIGVFDEAVAKRKDKNSLDKAKIAKYAASLITDDDFVYIDAGTTTELMTDYIECQRAVFVTNAIEIARRLAVKGLKVFIIGGEFKSATEAIVGEEAVYELDKYNFTIGFWGTNGIDMDRGFTTPESKEAAVKKTSMEHCKKRYVLADHTKFGCICGIRFSRLEDATIITTGKAGGVFSNIKKLVEVE